MEGTLRCLCLHTICPKMPSVHFEDLEETLEKYGQQHLLKFVPRLNPEERTSLMKDIQSIDFPNLMKAFAETSNNKETRKKLDEMLEPIPDELHGGVTRCTESELKEYREEGLRQIADGRVAVLLLAGGQGTRLGANYPKGMYNVGLPTSKTLYQLQAERIKRLEELSYQLTGKLGNIPWYIMTSEHTMDPTLDFFAASNYFGLKKENFFIFEQFMLPCLTFDGKVILEKPHKVARAPDGNGGMFKALKERGVIDDMTKRGIRYIHVYCVDNILVKMADPSFTGYCIHKKVNCAAKVVEKVSPTEAVGVVCRVNGKYKVVEYSEISSASAEKRNPDGRLMFSAGNICNHFFTLDFLRQIDSGNKLKYHVAKKKIPFANEDGEVEKPIKPNGIKLEKFVFDCFPLSNTFAAWEVCRDEEFSPLKNSDESEKDTPTTARQALYALHKKYIEKAGGQFTETSDSIATGEKICEISPLVSYDGEGLTDIVQGKEFTFPTVLLSAEEQECWRMQNSQRED